MRISDNISAIEAVEKAAKAAADAIGVTPHSDMRIFVEQAVKAAILAEARKAEAMKLEIAELREALRPFAAVAEHDIGNDETDEELFRPMNSHNRAPRLTVGSLRRARTLLNGGSDAQG